jgi:hypothetical protein
MTSFGIAGFALGLVALEATAVTAGAIAATWAAFGVATFGIGAVIGGVAAGIYAVHGSSWSYERALKDAHELVMLQLKLQLPKVQDVIINEYEQ